MIGSQRPLNVSTDMIVLCQGKNEPTRQRDSPGDLEACSSSSVTGPQHHTRHLLCPGFTLGPSVCRETSFATGCGTHTAAFQGFHLRLAEPSQIITTLSVGASSGFICGSFLIRRTALCPLVRRGPTPEGTPGTLCVPGDEAERRRQPEESRCSAPPWCLF